MGINIKNKETERLVRELTEVTGESMTTAVTAAVRERLSRVRSKEDGLAERLRAIAADCAAHMKEPYKSMDHAELLYDEQGLPK